MKNPAETGQKRILKGSSLLIIFVFLCAVIGVTAPFSHMFAEDQSPAVTAANEIYQVERTKRKEARKDLKAAFGSLKEGDVITSTQIQAFENYAEQEVIAAESFANTKKAKAETKFNGFKDFQAFLYAIGLPISLLFCSFLLLHSMSYLPKDEEATSIFKGLRISVYLASFAFLFTSVFFILWTVSSVSDFDIIAYYAAIIVVSAAISLAAVKYFSSIKSSVAKLSRVATTLPFLKKDIDVVNNLANIMPEKEDTVVFKAMLDVTGEDLNRKLSAVERELHDA